MKFKRNLYETGGRGERKDCSVRALSVAAGLTYEKAHSLFQQHGRRPKHPTSIVVSKRVYATLPYYEFKGTLTQFVKTHPVGKFIVHTRSHAFAICDGVVHDWKLHPRYKIVEYWKVA